MKCSRVFETAPIGGPPQEDFLNAAVLLRWEKEPLALLDELQAIERDLGRVRDVRWGPRTIDLDVLWMGDRVIDDERLVVPHPRLAERAFALAPMLDIVPDAIDPMTKQPYVLPVGDKVVTRGDSIR